MGRFLTLTDGSVGSSRAQGKLWGYGAPSMIFPGSQISPSGTNRACSLRA